jgi:phosphohistidine phosphatase
MSWSIKKGGVWWLSNRTRDGVASVTLKVAIAPDLV